MYIINMSSDLEGTSKEISESIKRCTERLNKETAVFNKQKQEIDKAYGVCLADMSTQTNKLKVSEEKLIRVTTELEKRNSKFKDELEAKQRIIQMLNDKIGAQSSIVREVENTKRKMIECNENNEQRKKELLVYKEDYDKAIAQEKEASKDALRDIKASFALEKERIMTNNTKQVREKASEIAILKAQQSEIQEVMKEHDRAKQALTTELNATIKSMNDLQKDCATRSLNENAENGDLHSRINTLSSTIAVLQSQVSESKSKEQHSRKQQALIENQLLKETTAAAKEMENVRSEMMKAQQNTEEKLASTKSVYAQSVIHYENERTKTQNKYDNFYLEYKTKVEILTKDRDEKTKQITRETGLVQTKIEQAVRRYKDELEQQTKQLQELQKQETQMIEQVKLDNGKFQKLDEQMAALRIEHKQVQDKAIGKEKIAQENIKSLKNRLILAENQITTNQAVMKKSANQMLEMHTKCDATKRSLDECGSSMKKTTEEYQTTAKELKDVHQTLTTMTERLNAANISKKELEIQLQVCGSRVSDTKKTMADLRQERQKSLEEVSALRSKVTSNDDLMRKLKNDLIECDDKNNMCISRDSKMKTVYTDLENRNAGCMKNSANCRLEVNQLKQEGRSQSMTLQQVQQQLKKLEQMMQDEQTNNTTQIEGMRKEQLNKTSTMEAKYNADIKLTTQLAKERDSAHVRKQQEIAREHKRVIEPIKRHVKELSKSLAQLRASIDQSVLREQKNMNQMTKSKQEATAGEAAKLDRELLQFEKQQQNIQAQLDALNLELAA